MRRALSPTVSALALVLVVGSVVGSQTAEAHFVLQNPPSATKQGILGDPQKAPPCGDDGDAVPTGKVTTYAPGQTITIKLKEMVPHPGHYRVALALNDPSELPPEPIVTPGTTACGSVEIDPSPEFPVLADGMLVHSSPMVGSQTFEVTLPSDVTCDHCTLQVLEFMSNHGLNNPGGCYYHHCATIAIQAPVAGDTDIVKHDTADTDLAIADTDVPSTDGGADTDTTPSASCGCDSSTGSAGAWIALSLVSLAAARRRR
jgi:uncharacterized protein (TIGR03382 family)